jgi:hypothetical protein
MNPKESSLIKMFGPSISDPSRIVNRDVPACDELAYKAAGYKRGSIDEGPEVSEVPEPVKPFPGSVELPMEPDPEPESEPAKPVVVDTKPRKKKGQN